MSNEEAKKAEEQKVSTPGSISVGDNGTAVSKMHKNLFGTHHHGEHGYNAKWQIALRFAGVLLFLIAIPLFISGVIVPDATTEQQTILNVLSVFLLAPLVGCIYFGTLSLGHGRILHAIKKNQMPAFIKGKDERMVVMSILLAREYNKLLSRWRRYLALCDTGACACSIDRDQMNRRLNEMKKEIERHVAITNAYKAMVDAGDFEEMQGNTLIADHLEHARDLQEAINREISGVNHAMIAPLHVEARMADAQAEVRKAIGESAAHTCTNDNKKQAAQKQAAQRRTC